jgi:HEAT repeat protein
LGWGELTFQEESVGILTRLLDDIDPYVVYCAAVGLSHRGAESAIPHLLKHVDHPDSLTRQGVVLGLSGHEDERAIEALIRLADDDDREVRDWAVFGLGSQIDTDSPEIRETLRKALGDPDDEIRGEALVGLAKRRDSSIVAKLLHEWRDDDVTILSIEAAEECRDPSLHQRLKHFAAMLTVDADPYFARRLAAAIEACSPKTEQG